MASICCSPPESVPAFCLMRSLSTGKSVKIRSYSDCLILSLRRYAPSSRLSLTVRFAKMPRPSGTCETPIAVITCGLMPVMSRPSYVTSPRLRLEQAGDRAQRRRLAGAVRADERDDLALVHVEVDAVQRRDVAVRDFEVADAEERGHTPAASAGSPR